MSPYESKSSVGYYRGEINFDEDTLIEFTVKVEIEEYRDMTVIEHIECEEIHAIYYQGNSVKSLYLEAYKEFVNGYKFNHNEVIEYLKKKGADCE